MNRVFWTVITLFAISAIQAQNFTIKGTIVDKETKTPLEATTIYAESIKDSVLIGYTISDGKGGFDLEGKTKLKNANVFFSFTGYQTLKRQLELTRPIDLGLIELQPQTQELKGVEVSAGRIPIKIKKDTLEFNASSFKTRPDANVEDVLKKLPGVEVDNNGKITVNGKEVNQILVNGKPFFGNDPKMATKNLPKEIIDKIQVADTKSKSDAFTGKESESETKTINLTIQEDKNKGYFGRLSAGYGTDDRYQLNGLYNKFDNEQRISVIASTNNINNPGFSFDEIFDMVGNRANSFSRNSNGGFAIGDLAFGFGEGIVTSNNLGASYADQLGKKSDVNANYFYTASNSFNETATNRENLLPDNRFFTEDKARFDGETVSHRAATTFEFEIDSTLRVTVSPNFTANKILSFQSNNTITLNNTNVVTNTNENFNSSEDNNKNFTNDFSVTKKFGRKGQYLSAQVKNENSLQEGTNDRRSSFTIGGGAETVINQRTLTNNRVDNYSVELNYRRPLVGEKLFLDLEYRYGNNKENNERSVFDAAAGTQDFDMFNAALSSDFRFRNIMQRPSIGLSYRGKKLRMGADANFVKTSLRNEDLLQGQNFKKTYNNLTSYSYIRYQFTKSMRASLSYSSSVRAPSVRQLQPIENVSNPLNIVSGNPNLNPTINHRLFVNFNNYDWKTRSGFFSYASVTFQDNNVARITTTDADLLRRTTYKNVNGSYNGWGNIQYSKQLKKDSVYTISANIGANGNFSKRVGFNNDVRLETSINNYSPYAGISFNYNELIELSPSYSYRINNTAYNLDALDDISFVSQEFTMKTTTYWPKHVVWGNDITYSFNENVGPGFDRSAIFWNMSLGITMLKEKATLKVLAYDLLNQNINTRRTSTQDYIQDSQGTVLQQYFMASFTYKFDKFGKKKKSRSVFF